MSDELDAINALDFSLSKIDPCLILKGIKEGGKMPDVVTRKRKKIFLMKDYQVLRGQEQRDLIEDQFLDHVFGLGETTEICTLNLVIHL